ncbi:FMRFamide related propeptide [Amblyomma americanum]
MKIALLLCIVGCYRGPFLLCAADDAKLLTHPETSPSPRHQPPQSDHIFDGARNVDAAATPEEQPGILNRVSRAAGSFDESGDVVDEYSAVRAALTGPRRHRFLHFGRKRALFAPYYGSQGLAADTASGEEDAEWSGGEAEDDADGAAASQESSKAAALRWAKRTLRQGPNGFLHFGKRDPELNGGAERLRFRRSVAAEAIQASKSDTEDIEQHHERAESTDAENGAQAPKTKRSSNRILHFGKRTQESATEGDGVKRASHNNLMHFGKRTNEEDVADALEHMYATVDSAVTKRAGNRIMHFGKRDPEYGISTGLEGEPEFELVTADKKAPNRILHFGKRPSGSSIEVETEDEVEENDKRGPLEHRIMHFGKRENEDLSQIMATNIEEAPDTAAKRAAATRSKYAGRTDQLQSVTGIGRQLQRQFQEWKKRNRILHFGKREPQQLQSRYYQAKRLGNRILHFGKRGGYTFYSSNQGPSSAAKDKRLKHSIMHFGKRENDLVSFTGGDKRNRIMHFGKRVGSELDMPTGDLPMDKRAGNRILHFGKRLEGADVAASPPTWPYDTHTNPSLWTDVSKRAHRILHFGKREGGTAYDDKGTETDTLVMGGDVEDSGASKLAGLGQPETQSMVRKKRSTSSPRPNEDIDDTLAEMMSELMGEEGYADRITMGHSGLSGPLHLPHAYVAAQVYGNAFPRMLSRPSRSDRLFRALYSGEHGAETMPKGTSRNVFLHFG